MTKEDIIKLVDSNETASGVFMAMRDVRAYCNYNSVLKLGITMDVNTVPFEKLMVFGWIKELIDGRKN